MKKKGFTLVEVVVTLMIIITLSLLSFPLYKGRNHKTSVLAEGYALLGTVVSAQVAYFNEYGNFLAPQKGLYGGWSYNIKTCNDPILGINAMNNRYFTSFNPYATGAYVGNPPIEYVYHFTAIVYSTQSGTISLEYNITRRFNPVVSGV